MEPQFSLWLFVVLLFGGMLIMLEVGRFPLHSAPPKRIGRRAV